MFSLNANYVRDRAEYDGGAELLQMYPEAHEKFKKSEKDIIDKMQTDKEPNGEEVVEQIGEAGKGVTVKAIC
jgi:hypothetical protein